jgi:hypothetical protein
VTGHVLHEIFILAANGAHKGHWKKNSHEFKRCGADTK